MTTRNRQATALTLACLCAAALVGCTNDSPDAGQPNTAPPASGTASTASTPPPSNVTPSASTPGVIPERPKAAEGASLAAAEAFVHYYSDLMNYASDTGDPAPMLDASEAGCENCKSYATFVKKSNAANGLLTGDYHEHLKEVSELVRGDNGQLGGSATITIGAYISRETASATPFQSKPATYTRELALSQQNGDWVMFEMKQTEQ